MPRRSSKPKFEQEQKSDSSRRNSKLTSGSTGSISIGQMSDAKVTESEKRKKVDGDGAVTGRKKKAREDNRDSTVGATEEEVEEFFAILRRIHEAVSYFKKDEAIGDGGKLTDEGSRLRTMLESVGVDEANGVKGEVRRDREEGMEENLGLDLNAEPGPEF